MGKIMQLDWSKTAKQFSVNACGKFLYQYQASRQASAQPGVFLSQNFVFRQDWVGRKVTGMKKNLFLSFLTQSGPNLIFFAGFQ